MGEGVAEGSGVAAGISVAEAVGVADRSRVGTGVTVGAAWQLTNKSNAMATKAHIRGFIVTSELELTPTARYCAVEPFS
jgi:hypothetical protein